MSEKELIKDLEDKLDLKHDKLNEKLEKLVLSQVLQDKDITEIKQILIEFQKETLEYNQKYLEEAQLELLKQIQSQLIEYKKGLDPVLTWVKNPKDKAKRILFQVSKVTAIVAAISAIITAIVKITIWFVSN